MSTWSDFFKSTMIKTTVC